MRMRGATIWVVLAGLLGALLMWVRAAPGGGVGTETFPLGLDSAAVIGLRVETPNGAAVSVNREGDGHWVLEHTGEDGAHAAWPADESRVRGGVRLLASSVFDTREAEVPPESPLGSLFITMRGGVETEIVFDSRGIGGRVPVRVRTGDGFRSGWADRSMLDAYLRGGVGTGLAAWRDRSITVSAALADRLMIEVLGERVSLRKINGRWVLNEPVMIEADASVVQTVLAALSSIEIGRFLDSADPTDAAYGLTDPVGVLEIGWSGRGTGGKDRTLRLSLGSMAEVSGESLHARASIISGDREFGPRVVTMGVPEFPDTVDSYLRGQASSLSTADVRGLAVRKRAESSPAVSFTRTIEGWTLDDGPDRDGVGQTIVDFVCSSSARHTELVSGEMLDALPGYLGEIGLIIGGGVEAEVFGVALPTVDTPTLRLIGKDLGEGTHAVWSYSGPNADRVVGWCIDWFGL